jgi:hypothetical protein
MRRVRAQPESALVVHFFLVWWSDAFAGVLANCHDRSWCFCGEFVVECVVKDGPLMVDFSLSKTCHTFQLYFVILALAVMSQEVVHSI